MKHLVLFTALLLSLQANSGFIFPGAPLWCAPEVESGNLAATERILSELTQREEFNGAEVFKSEVARISRMENPKTKIQAYQKVLGIQTVEEYAEFLGARNNDQRRPQIDNAMESLQLSQTQAELMVDQLSKALIGNLQ